MKMARITAVVALIVGSGMAPHVALAQQPGIKRTDLRDSLGDERRHRQGGGALHLYRREREAAPYYGQVSLAPRHPENCKAA